MAQREVFMSKQRYPEEFKIEAVKQVTVSGHSVADVAQRLGTTTHSLYCRFASHIDPLVAQKGNPL